MVNSVRNIIAAANNALQEEIDDDFQQVVQRTRRSFRPSGGGSVRPRRGRRSLGFFRRRVLLLRRSNADYCPIRTECDMLTSCGLGYSDNEPKFELNWNIEEIEEYICSLYPKAPLHLIGFKIAKADRQKKIIYINIENASQLKDHIGQSQIIAVPNQDIPYQLQFTSFEINSKVRSQQDRQSFVLAPSSQSDRPLNTSPPTRRQLERRSDSPQANDIQIHTPLNQSFFDNDDPHETISEFILVVPKLDADAEEYSINITREKCVHQMFSLYENDSIVKKKLSVTFEGELGLDGGGLTKELFSLFFKNRETVYFRGEDTLVPWLPLNRVRKEKKNFEIIGRILEHMLISTGNLPTKLSKITLLLISDPKKEIEEDILIQELYNFVNPCERDVLKKAVESFSYLNRKEKDVLTNIFTSFQFYEVPSTNHIFEQVAAIALNILVDLPKQFIEVMRRGINLDKYNSFWNRCDFGTLLEFQKPTSKKVANCLKAQEILTNEQTTILHFLEMYVRCLNDEKVEQFVFFYHWFLSNARLHLCGI